MVAVNGKGLGEFLSAPDSRADAVGVHLVGKFQGWAIDEGVFDEMFECLRRNLNAKKSQRIEDPSKVSGYGYEVTEDGLTQIAAARTLAQILRLMPQSAGVTVNNTTQTVNVTAADRLAELDSIGDDAADDIVTQLLEENKPESASVAVGNEAIC